MFIVTSLQEIVAVKNIILIDAQFAFCFLFFLTYFYPGIQNKVSLISSGTADVDSAALLAINPNESSLCQPLNCQQYFCTMNHFCHQHFLKKKKKLRAVECTKYSIANKLLNIWSAFIIDKSKQTKMSV